MQGVYSVRQSTRGVANWRSQCNEVSIILPDTVVEPLLQHMSPLAKSKEERCWRACALCLGMLMGVSHGDQDAMTLLDWRFAFGYALEVPNSSPKTARVLCGRRRPSVTAPWRNQEVSCACGCQDYSLQWKKKLLNAVATYKNDIWHIHLEGWWNCHAYDRVGSNEGDTWASQEAGVHCPAQANDANVTPVLNAPVMDCFVQRGKRLSKPHHASPWNFLTVVCTGLVWVFCCLIVLIFEGIDKVKSFHIEFCLFVGSGFVCWCAHRCI